MIYNGGYTYVTPLRAFCPTTFPVNAIVRYAYSAPFETIPFPPRSIALINLDSIATFIRRPLICRAHVASRFNKERTIGNRKSHSRAARSPFREEWRVAKYMRSYGFALWAHDAPRGDLTRGSRWATDFERIAELRKCNYYL